MTLFLIIKFSISQLRLYLTISTFYLIIMAWAYFIFTDFFFLSFF